MRITNDLKFYTGSREEHLPYRDTDFPYLSSRARLDDYSGKMVPWHWHKAVELFYMESGEIRYETPEGIRDFPEGSGGMVNSNVLHMTTPQSRSRKNTQLLHLFDPGLIGGTGDRIGQKYVQPIVTALRPEILVFSPEHPDHRELLRMIRQAFELQEKEWGYEIKIRNVLSEIWLRIWEIFRPEFAMEGGAAGENTDQVKEMMIYIQEHYAEKISVAELAQAAWMSERECYRAFRTCLHMTPAEYMRNYRLQMACRLLAEGVQPVTEIGYACGLGSASHFGKLFRDYAGCTPLAYRKKCDRSMKNEEIL